MHDVEHYMSAVYITVFDRGPQFDSVLLLPRMDNKLAYRKSGILRVPTASFRRLL